MSRNAKVLLFGVWTCAAMLTTLTGIGWLVVRYLFGQEPSPWWMLWLPGSFGLIGLGFFGVVAYAAIDAAGEALVSYIEREQRPKIGGEG